MTMTTGPVGAREAAEQVPCANKRAAGQSTAVIRTLLAATASREGDPHAAVDRIGAGTVARVLLEEVLFRANLADLAAPVGDTFAVTLAFKHAGREYPATVAVGPRGVTVHDDPADAAAGLPAPVVSQDLVEAAFALYGPSELVSASTRAIRWPGPEVVHPSPERPSLPTAFLAVVQRVIRVLDRGEPADLAELAVRYGTDKWGAMHQYPRHYQRHFSPLRNDRLTVLEIGVGGFLDPARAGASLRTWKHYFPRALVYGLDILDKSAVDAPRLTTIRADQSDDAELARIAERYGPFDIVIDDGSHLSRHVIGTFKTLFPHLAPDGLYVIEDLQACYWPEAFEGSDTDLSDPGFTIGFLKTLLDGLHHEDFLRADARLPQATDTAISGVHVYRNLAVIEKGPNAEGSMVAEILRANRAAGLTPGY
jgi:8-demethyl-8-alpha-L-rhamnosyltetracenomycin-C 2'-O-methyltransferase